jgi:hypothetical protein
MKHTQKEFNQFYITLIVVVVLSIAIAYLGINKGFESKINLIEKTK